MEFNVTKKLIITLAVLAIMVFVGRAYYVWKNQTPPDVTQGILTTKKENFEATGNLVRNNAGSFSEIWYLNHTFPGRPGPIIKLDLSQVTPSFSLSAGAKVRVSGILNENELTVKTITQITN